MPHDQANEAVKALQGGSESVSGLAGAALGTAGNIGSLGISSLIQTGISQMFAGKNERRQAKLRERQALLDSTNDYEKFLAQMQVTDPQSSINSLLEARNTAAILGSKGGGLNNVNFDGPGGSIQGGSDVKRSADPDGSLKAIIATLQDAGKSNLKRNASTGLMDFVKPQLDLAVSKDLSKDKKHGSTFKQSGQKRTFGAGPGGAAPAPFQAPAPTPPPTEL